MKTLAISILFLIILTGNKIISQEHWETAVYSYDQWRYFVGESEPLSSWKDIEFNDSNWNLGAGSIGYGDEDDLTEIEQTISLYIRRTFNVEDIAQLSAMILHADYDDGFIAYVNGFEIARAPTMDVPGIFFGFQDEALDNHEAAMYQGGVPEAYGVSIPLENILTNGVNVLAVQVHNVNFSSSDLSSNFFLSFSVESGSSFFGEVPQWFYEPLDYTICNLPILTIDTYGEDIADEPRITAHLGIINNETGNTSLYDDFNGYEGLITIERRGNSSQWQPKPPYRFETINEDGSNNNVSLLGMPEENDWVLYAPWSDKSLVRNVLTYHLSNIMGRYASRSRFIELFINGDYRGVYVLMEKIKRDDNRVDIENLVPEETEGDELTGGYILKFDWGGTGENNGGFHSAYDGNLYNYHYPKPDEIVYEQEEYIYDFIYDFETIMSAPNYNDLESGYSSMTNISSFVDLIVLQELSKNVDAYRLSTYIYKDIDSADDRLTAGPIWDVNHGYGNCDYGETWEHEGWLLEYNPEGGDQMSFWWERMWEDEYFQTLINARWNYLRSNVLSDENVEYLIDSLVSHIGNAQIKNFNRWPTLGQYVWPNYYVFDSYEEEVEYLKEWTFDRIEWIDSEFIINDEPALPNILINEILASNDTTNVDEAGEYDDWLEIYNLGEDPADMGGYFLTDNDAQLTKWMIPPGTEILPQSFLIFWCDEDQEQGELHTNFKLSAGGEFLALVAFDGVTILDSITFGAQSADTSYGRVSDGESLWGFLAPTPGAVNVSPTTEISISYNDGWNLVGVPLIPEDFSYTEVFPDAVSGTCYSFNGNYVMNQVMAIGEGYWIRFDDFGFELLSGAPINDISNSLSEGWNLISGISLELGVDAISDPNDIILSGTFYGFEGVYVNSSTLTPGKGYWVNALADGEVTISSRLSKSVIDFNDKTLEANKLNINGIDLYFGASIAYDEKRAYSLPPRPPEGVFDARFKDDMRLVNNFGELDIVFPTEVLSISYDIEIETPEHMSWVLTSEIGRDYPIKGRGELTIPSSDRLLLKLQPTIPDRFTLYQNYPNPFNPITTLSYDLPTDSHVKFTIYDMLGNEVALLINNVQKAGFKSLKWNAKESMGLSLAAGLYFYKIEAGEFFKVKKMVILK